MLYKLEHGVIPVWGEVDEKTVLQALNCLRFSDHFAVMADGHYGYAVPIGGVMVMKDRISPSGVGFDIACGNKAVRTDADVKEVKLHLAEFMDAIWNKISFGVGRKNNEKVDHELFEDETWKLPAFRDLRDQAILQLGTVGSGNHYVDLFEDEENRIWIGCHFGSRGLGYKIANHFLKAAAAKQNMEADPLVLDSESEMGSEYILGMELAGRYAYAGRDWVCNKVAEILGANTVEEVHNHHNYAWKETHNGEEVWVVRKGATPAFPGQKGFVGSSMGEPSVILEGVDSPESAMNFYSTVHGAGRVMSRTAAAGKFNRKTGELVAEGCVKPSMMAEWLNKANVLLKGGGLDESPHCYKRLSDVLSYHDCTVRILHTLTPLGVAMAGADEFDPYKD